MYMYMYMYMGFCVSFKVLPLMFHYAGVPEIRKISRITSRGEREGEVEGEVEEGQGKGEGEGEGEGGGWVMEEVQTVPEDSGVHLQPGTDEESLYSQPHLPSPQHLSEELPVYM